MSSLTIERARAARRNPTPTERKLWARLRRRQLDGLRFRRQHPLGDYILDFFCFARRLAVEVDGDYHRASNQKAWDAERDRFLCRQRITVLRVTADEVRDRIDDVLARIQRAACRSTPTTRSPNSPTDSTSNPSGTSNDSQSTFDA